MKVTKKIDDKMIKMHYGVENAILNPDSKIRCDKCKERLGIARMMKKSLFVKKGSVYGVICKSCGKVNKRVKGEIGVEMDKKWKKYGTEAD